MMYRPLNSLGLALLCTALTGMSACGDSGNNTTTEDPTEATEANTTTPTTAGPGGTDTMSGTNPSGTMGMTEGSTSNSTLPTSTTSTTDPTDTTDSTSTTGVDDCPIFEEAIVPIFEKSCGVDNMMCHRREAYGAAADSNCRGWLTLENVALGSVFYSGPNEGDQTGCPDIPLYNRLVELDAWQCEAFDPLVKYVIPCDADASYLVRKIDGGPYCQNGMGEVTQPMPPGVQMDPNDITTIKEWINAGAPTLANPECGCMDDPDPSDTNGMVGNAPEVQINHPGDGEDRAVNVPIPFIGVAQDVEDGELTGMSLVWESDVDGFIGQGNNFNEPLSTLGQHTITLTATDSDDNASIDQIQINVIP